MSFVFITSVLLKGIGAAVEILIQVIITRQMGVAEFGNYSTFVNAADLIYWFLFSGIVKCNTFYLSEKGATIRSFKKKYYIRYVIPVTLLGIVGSALTKQYLVGLVFAIAIAELCVMDFSSSFMARSYYIRALVGEYVLGRVLLLLGICTIFALGHSTTGILVVLYMVQFALLALYFGIQKLQLPVNNLEKEVSIAKWGNYQRADIFQSLIIQVPVILQYVAVGSFEAGVVSVVLLVKKLVNFISGPSFKVFLPEFSRLYKQGDVGEIKRNFALIMRMQMLFLAPLTVILVGFPSVLLGVMASELLKYTTIFIICSLIFIIVASIGPCSGLLQMTGNEKWDNRFREVAILLMFVTFWLLRKEPLFVLYGLCIQTIIENSAKFYFVSKWMGGLPVHILTYLKWWLSPAGMILLANILKLQQSFLAMLGMAFVVFVFNFVYEIKDQSLLDVVKKRKK